MASYQKMLMFGVMTATLFTGHTPSLDDTDHNKENKVNYTQSQNKSRETHQINLRDQIIDAHQKDFKIIRKVGRSTPKQIQVINNDNENITTKGSIYQDDKQFSWVLNANNQQHLKEVLGEQLNYKIYYTDGKQRQFKQNLKYT